MSQGEVSHKYREEVSISALVFQTTKRSISLCEPFLLLWKVLVYTNPLPDAY